MPEKFKKLKKSIAFRIIIPVLLVFLLESLSVASLLYFNVIENTINQSLVTNFQSTVNVRKNYVENLISNSWNNIDSIYTKIEDETKSLYRLNSKKSQTSLDTLLTDEDESIEYLCDVSSYLNEMITSNKVNDAYIILDNQFPSSDKKLLVYMRSKNPKFSSNSQVDILFAPQRVWNIFYEQGYGLDNTIESNSFSDIKNTEFFSKPLEYYKENQTVQGYWSSLATIKSNRVLTYSMPLVVDGKLLGVLGIGLTENYLKTSLSSLNKGEEINISLAQKSDGKFLGYFNSFMDYSLPNYEKISLSQTKYQDIQEFENDGVMELYDEVSLNFYNNANPFDEQWSIIGILPKDKVFKASNAAIHQIIYIYLITFVLLILISIVVSVVIARPIVKVSSSLNGENITDIPLTNITEVDTLIQEINSYSKKNLSLNNKLKRIIEDSSLQVGFFEYTKKDKMVSSTAQFFKMLFLDCKEETLSKEDFLDLLYKVKESIVSSTYSDLDESILEKPGEISFYIQQRFLQMKIVMQDYGAIATLIDQTKAYEEKKKILHERDYDPLTGLLNRRGFLLKVKEVMKKEVDASFFMIDIDNLKYINDQYGHDVGDEYLRTVGRYLGRLGEKFAHFYSCHVSGDEFVLYLFEPQGGEKDELVQELTNISKESLTVKNGRIFISLSIGICQYRKGMTFEEMNKKADYAMYLAKSSGKNCVRAFDKEAEMKFQYETILYEDLLEIIDKKLLQYAYQPIIDIHNGEILGYEALMRPKIKGLSPLSVLNAAKKYNRLYDIEKLTSFLAPETFFSTNSDKKLFINSISSQVLNDEDLSHFVEAYKDKLDRFVVELIEEDMGQNKVIQRKIEFFNQYNITYAIDDYGTGYNNIGMILSYTPEFVKIEGSLIRNIDKDEKKQRLAKSILSYCSINHIKVVAESVETVEELKMVKDLGVDYVQGFLLAKPEFEIKDLPEEKKELVRSI